MRLTSYLKCDWRDVAVGAEVGDGVEGVEGQPRREEDKHDDGEGARGASLHLQLLLVTSNVRSPAKRSHVPALQPGALIVGGFASLFANQFRTIANPECE